jgi:hypothetical protein
MLKILAFRGRVKAIDGFSDGVVEVFPTARSGIWSVRWVLEEAVKHLTGHPRFCKVARLEGNPSLFDN